MDKLEIKFNKKICDTFLTGTANNAGAILVVGRGLVIVPKLIHPLPPPILSPENSPEHSGDDAWMQVTTLLLLLPLQVNGNLVIKRVSFCFNPRKMGTR